MAHAELVAHPSETDLRTTILREHLLERTRTVRVLFLGEEQSKCILNLTTRASGRGDKYIRGLLSPRRG